MKLGIKPGLPKSDALSIPEHYGTCNRSSLTVKLILNDIHLYLTGTQTEELREPDVPGAEWAEGTPEGAAVRDSHTERPARVLQSCPLCQWRNSG